MTYQAPQNFNDDVSDPLAEFEVGFDDLDNEVSQLDLFNGSVRNERLFVMSSDMVRDAILETFIELQDFVVAESLFIADAGWNMYYFAEFLASLERQES